MWQVAVQHWRFSDATLSHRKARGPIDCRHRLAGQVASFNCVCPLTQLVVPPSSRETRCTEFHELRDSCFLFINILDRDPAI